MNDVMLTHVMKRYKKLNSKSSDKPYGYTLKVVTLDKLIEIHAQHFKRKNKMLSKHELFFYSDDVLFVVLIIIFELFKNLSFNQALFVESLFIS